MVSSQPMFATNGDMLAYALEWGNVCDELEPIEQIVLSAVSIYIGAAVRDYWRRHMKPKPRSGEFARYVVKSGNIDLLAWIVQNSMKSGHIHMDDFCTIAAGAGQLALLERGLYYGLKVDLLRIGSHAAQTGNKQLLRWFGRNAVNTHAEVGDGGAQYMDNLCMSKPTNYQCGYDCCVVAARQGSLVTLQWAIHSGYLFCKRTCAAAAENGHLHILQWLKAYGCPWDESTCTGAAANGHLQVLQWVRQKNCPWDQTTCGAAAQYGQLETLRWARANGCPWGADTVSAAASIGRLDIIRYAYAHGCPWDSGTCARAAHGGHLHVLRWVRRRACPWDTMTCAMAASNGHLGVLRWALANGFRWHATVCQSVCRLAASNGHMHVLRWVCAMKGQNTNNRP